MKNCSGSLRLNSCTQDAVAKVRAGYTRRATRKGATAPQAAVESLAAAFPIVGRHHWTFSRWAMSVFGAGQFTTTHGRKRATLRGKHDRSVGSGASLPPIPSCKRVRTHYSADLELERLPMAGLPVRYTRCQQHRPNRSSRSFQVSLKAELLQCISVSLKRS